MLQRFDDALVVIRPIAEVPDDALAPGERGLADAVTAPHRRLELRAGRAAARAVMSEAGLSPFARSVLVAPDGRPMLDPPGDDAISLAHDGGFVAAAYARRPVGIDLVALDRITQVERVVAARLSRDGRSLDLAGLEPRWPASVLLWSGWEAAGKRTGGGVLSGPMQRTWRLRRDEDLLGATDGEVRLRWFEHGGCLVCLAT